MIAVMAVVALLVYEKLGVDVPAQGVAEHRTSCGRAAFIVAAIITLFT